MKNKIPKHVLIVWNPVGDLSTSFDLSHLEEVSNNLLDIVEFCQQSKIGYLTIHVFPNLTEQSIIGHEHKFTGIIDQVLLDSIQKLTNENVRVSITGDLKIFSDELVGRMSSITKETKNNTGLHLNFLINCSGKQEIIKALKLILRKNIPQKELDEVMFRGFLLMPNLPDPDLEIITGGDYRIQDTLIWQSTYAEMNVSDSPWFSYHVSNFMDAINDYANRERRFGVLPSQIWTKEKHGD